MQIQSFAKTIKNLVKMFYLFLFFPPMAEVLILLSSNKFLDVHLYSTPTSASKRL